MATPGEQTVDLLSRVPVFAELEADELAQVADVAVPRSFDVGEVVFREGDDSDTCYVVRDGHARAVRSHPDGRTITLASFGPGDIFGELAMFDDEKRSATVEAVDDLRVVALLGPDMRRLLHRHPEIATKLLATVTRRLRAANERLARQSFQTVQSRVAGVLATLVEQARHGAEGNDGGRRADLAHPVRHRPAGRLGARVGLAVPGRAGARRGRSPRAAGG